MTRTERLVALLAFFVALAILFAVAGLVGALGPLELVLVVLMALPLAVALFHVGRRRLLRRPDVTRP